MYLVKSPPVVCMQCILQSSINNSAASFSVSPINSFTATSARDVTKSTLKLVAECLHIPDIMFNKDPMCSVDIFEQQKSLMSIMTQRATAISNLNYIKYQPFYASPKNIWQNGGRSPDFSCLFFQSTRSLTALHLGSCRPRYLIGLRSQLKIDILVIPRSQQEFIKRC